MDLCFAGSSGAREGITGPGTVRGPERGNLSVRCHYDKGWETYKKYWCRGAAWSHCEILIITTGSEQEVRQGRVTIRDHHRNRTFTVTMEQLREDDADIYWCGMERVGTDPGVQVKVIVDPGKGQVCHGSALPWSSKPCLSGLLEWGSGLGLSELPCPKPFPCLLSLRGLLLLLFLRP